MNRSGAPNKGPGLADEVARLSAELHQLREELDRARQYIAALQKQADEDPLVPLLNRRAFARELGLMLALAERYGVAGSVIYFDLKDLKTINDRYGHAAGDAALLHVADVLRAHTRTSDIVGRLGGDEFAVLLQRADRATAEAKAAELAGKIHKQPVDCGQEAIPVHVDFGVNVFSGNETEEYVIAEADNNMYQRKQRKS